MTLVVAWLRNYSNIQEVVVASDSRLSGGGVRWNCCPKIVSLPRSDAVLAFAGVTDIAYPAMLQVIRAIEANPASVERRYDLTQLADVIQDVLNQMLDYRVVDPVVLDAAHADKAETTFVLAGWSWRYQQFRMWRYVFHRGERRYHRHKTPPRRSVQLLVAGDVSGAAMQRFNALRVSRNLTATDPLNMEPLEVLRDMIRSNEYYTVGGAPQLMKVYRHMNAESFGVLWRNAPESDAIATYGGRPLLDYEKSFFTLIDPDYPVLHAKSSVAARTAQPTVPVEGAGTSGTEQATRDIIALPRQPNTGQHSPLDP